MRNRRALAPGRVFGATTKHVVLLAFSALAALPLYFMLVNAFKTQDEYISNAFGLPRHWVLSSFRGALHGSSLFLWLGNSTLVTLASVALVTLVAALAAYPLSLMRWRPSNVVTSILIALMVIPPIVLVVPLFQIVIDLGGENTYLAAVAIYAGLMLPFSTFLLASYFATIPREIVDAARVDGAGRLRTLLRIVLPLSAPVLVTNVVVQSLWVWNELLIALVFLNADQRRTLMVGITIFQSRYKEDIPQLMAGMLWATIPMVVLYVAGQRFFIRGLTAGATKG